MGVDVLRIDGFEGEIPAPDVAICCSGYRIYLRLGVGNPEEDIWA
jgi:hypothetical protein